MNIMKSLIFQNRGFVAGTIRLTGPRDPAGRGKIISVLVHQHILLMAKAGNGMLLITRFTSNHFLKNQIPFEREILTPVQQVNEYIMTSLRTAEGLDLERIWSQESGPDSYRVRSQEFIARSQKFINEGKIILKENKLLLTKEGKLFADGIAADLFIDSV